MAARVYDMQVKTKLDDETEYNDLVVGEEFDYCGSERFPDGLYISFVGRESESSVIRDSNRKSNYIDTRSTFDVEGIGNGDSAYSGATRDWKIVSGGIDLLSGDFAISFDWEIVKRDTLKAIAAISETNISVKNWFISLTVVADGQLDMWKDYHLFYQKEGVNYAKIVAYGNKGTVNSTPANLTATKIKITFVRREATIYMPL